MECFLQGWAPRSLPFRTFRSFKEHNILFRSFFDFLATYETQKNFLFCSFLKNGKERKEPNILLQRM